MRTHLCSWKCIKNTYIYDHTDKSAQFLSLKGMCTMFECSILTSRFSYTHNGELCMYVCTNSLNLVLNVFFFGCGEKCSYKTSGPTNIKYEHLRLECDLTTRPTLIEARMYIYVEDYLLHETSNKPCKAVCSEPFS